jgi:hypothetical protein
MQPSAAAAVRCRRGQRYAGQPDRQMPWDVSRAREARARVTKRPHRIIIVRQHPDPCTPSRPIGFHMLVFLLIGCLLVFMHSRTSKSLAAQSVPDKDGGSG